MILTNSLIQSSVSAESPAFPAKFTTLTSRDVTALKEPSELMVSAQLALETPPMTSKLKSVSALMDIEDKVISASWAVDSTRSSPTANAAAEPVSTQLKESALSADGMKSTTRVLVSAVFPANVTESLISPSEDVYVYLNFSNSSTENVRNAPPTQPTTTSPKSVSATKDGLKVLDSALEDATLMKNGLTANASASLDTT